MREKSKLTEQPLLKPTRRWRIGLGVAAVIAIGAVALNRLQQGQNQATAPTPVTSSAAVVTAVSALGRLEPQGEVIRLSAPSTAQGARVEQLLVKEGERVRAKEVVAVLDNRDRASAALEQAKGQLQIARANLAKVKAGAQTGEIQAQKAAIARLEAQLRGEIVAQEATVARLLAELQGQREILQATVARTQAEQLNALGDYQRYQSLYDSGAISAQELERRRLSAQTTTEQVNESQATRSEKVATLQQELNEAKANRDKTVATLQQQIAEAKATLNKIVEVRPVDVQVATAEVVSAIAGVKQAQADLALTEVKAPIASEILEIHARPGETISEDGIAQLGRTDQMVVVAEIIEEDIGKVRLGQKATITSENEAFAGKIQGTVTEIGNLIGKQDVLDTDPAADVDARVVEVKIGLSPEDGQRVSGLTNAKVVAEIKI
jgi:HlyD family secretion protein